MNRNRSNNKIVAAAVIGVVIVLGLVLVAGIKVMKNDDGEGGGSGKTLEEMLENVDITKATPTKASVSLNDPSLYDELPDISKYPLAVQGNGDVDIEIFAPSEKAGKDTDAWLIDAAESFNALKMKSGSKTVSISVRCMSSGQGADYIISGKYLPDLYTPSNSLFGEYAMAKCSNITLYSDKLVGNTAGILVRKNSGYTDVNKVIQDVVDGKINIGYTNPQTSAAGLNLLMQILMNADKDDMFSQKAIDYFTQFNSNIPFIAYTTQQMRDSAGSGILDGMVSEYQSYINDENLRSVYDFLPFGIRHDGPVYITSSAYLNKKDAVKIVMDFLQSTEMQKKAENYGFNQNTDYKSAFDVSGSQVSRALETYKSFKDGGRDIAAVFVADCSGSMAGDAIQQLRTSLSNGMTYIKENNYVGLISYSNDVTIELPMGKFDLTQKSYFQGAVNNMQANGGTSSYEAVLTAIKMINDLKKDNPDVKPMIFLLSDGMANGEFTLEDTRNIIKDSKIPIYTIGYTSSADTDELQKLSNINEAASINADSDDIIYKIKSLFNSQL